MFNFYLKEREKLNVVSRSVRTVRNIIFGIFFGYLILMIFLNLVEDNRKGFIFSAYEQAKAKYVEIVKRDNISALNGDGSVNGLNLDLINQLQDGFIKEYLTIAKDNQEGKLNSETDHTPVECVIGLAMGEQGGYPQSGYNIPATCLPWDSSTKLPKWQKDSDWTLAKADMSILASNHFEPAWMDGGYVSPYQQTKEYFVDGTYKPSNMTGAGMSSGRTTGDWSYFPDQLSGLDHEYSNIQGIDVSNLIPQARCMISSENHNVGPSWKDQFFGVYKNGDISGGIDVFSKEFEQQFNKFKDKIGAKIIEPTSYKWVALFMLMDDGWYVTTRDGEPNSKDAILVRNRSVCLEIFQQLGLGSTDAEMEAYVNEHYKNPSDYGLCRHASTQGTIWKDFGSDGIMYCLTETAGHMLCSSFMGPIYYARLLQLGGVAGVDPTNPSSYMNQQKSSGQWTPDGNTDWMKEAQIDMSKLNDARAKTLQEGHKLLGTYYDHSRPVREPNYDANGQAVPKTGGMDCSGFVEFIIRKVTGQSIGYPQTDSLMSSSALTEIPPDQMKPGDLIILGNAGRTGTEHVVMYLSGNCNRDTTTGFWYMDTGNNDTGGVKVSGTGWQYQKNSRRNWYYFHVNAYGD